MSKNGKTWHLPQEEETGLCPHPSAGSTSVLAVASAGLHTPAQRKIKFQC